MREELIITLANEKKEVFDKVSSMINEDSTYRCVVYINYRGSDYRGDLTIRVTEEKMYSAILTMISDIMDQSKKGKS